MGGFALDFEDFSFCLRRFVAGYVSRRQKEKGQKDKLTKTYLISVEIPEGVKEIPEALFMGSVFLKSIVIPSSVTAIDGHFIWNCYRLEEIICKSRIPPTFVKNPLDGIMPGLKIVVKAPKGTVNAYKNAEGWKDLEIVEEKKGSRPNDLIK